MLIGLDLDNTIIDYDAAFARVGKNLAFLPAGFTGTKRDVRQYLWHQPEGDLLWQALQAQVYGPGIGEATPSPGVKDFIARCRGAGFELAVVSHKTAFAAADPGGANLRDCALGWLSAQGVCAGEHGMIDLGSVYFTDTRSAKLQRIAALGCDFFVDDLEEVLLDAEFPPQTIGLYFAPMAGVGADAALRVCRSWADVGVHIFADIERIKYEQH